MEKLKCQTQNINYGKDMKIQIQSIITCPQCGYQKEEFMPVDACQYFMSVGNVKQQY